MIGPEWIKAREYDGTDFSEWTNVSGSAWSSNGSEFVTSGGGICCVNSPILAGAMGVRVDAEVQIGNSGHYLSFSPCLQSSDATLSDRAQIQINNDGTWHTAMVGGQEYYLTAGTPNYSTWVPVQLLFIGGGVGGTIDGVRVPWQFSDRPYGLVQSLGLFTNGNSVKVRNLTIYRTKTPTLVHDPLAALERTNPTFLWTGEDAGPDLAEANGGPDLVYQSGTIAYQDIALCGRQVFNAEDALFSTTDAAVVAAGAASWTLSWTEIQTGGSVNGDIWMRFGAGPTGIMWYADHTNADPHGIGNLNGVSALGAHQTLTSGAVRHMAIRRVDGGNSSVWIDGVQVADTGTAAIDPATSLEMFIRSDAATQGTKAFVALHNRALYDGEITTLAGCFRS